MSQNLEIWHQKPHRIGRFPLTVIHQCIGAFFVPVVVEADVSESEDIASETGTEDSVI